MKEIKSFKTVVLLIISFFASNILLAEGPKSIYDWAKIRLDQVKNDRIQQLERYCENVHLQAQKINQEKLMVDFFNYSNQFHKFSKKGLIPQHLKDKMTDFKKIIQDNYIRNYISFYDILFVKPDGEIFYTIRKENDLSKNVFEDEFKNTPLSKALRSRPQKEMFVDFSYYKFSNEPAAFFIEPAIKNGNFMGWFVMQVAINKINSLFAGSDDLGSTGEAFLINNKGFMLTESNFAGDSTILKTRLDAKNIKPKFLQGSGHREVTDYRGYDVITSFEVFKFLGTKWLIVAKVDKSQIVTEHYINHPKYFFNNIYSYLKKNEFCNQVDQIEIDLKNVKTMMVDMDEYVKAKNNQALKTVGVSTCTAVVATYPGKFGYMAHLSPYDKMYGKTSTNLLSNIIKKISFYDIYRYEQRKIEFIVVANHLKSMDNIINKICSEGFLLEQIHILFNPEARSVNVFFDYSKNLIYAQWNFEDKPSILETQCKEKNLEYILEQFIGKTEKTK